MLTLEDRNFPERKEIYFGPNAKNIGYFYPETGRQWVFAPSPTLEGFWSAHMLRLLSDELNNLNENEQT